MTTRDEGVWREQRNQYPAGEDALPQVLFAVHDTAEALARNVAGELLAPDWSRVSVQVHHESGGLVVRVGTWCQADGRSVEFGIAVRDQPITEAGPGGVEFLDEDQIDGIEDVHRRVAGPWEPVGGDVS